eukprot:CAMPEP_0180153106 /NCGR_PEP_ID=MMETSP0986-20121125/23284_1 /TAXON_ID=697907 /ORGANISM="non described non described, Strain CCMP2293" /LENGTH=66 /DNA_ID=CAMNT_0022101043 /DNA_START=86 /DNA_END=282 /DNA_ORIENTATION=-
MAMPVAPQARVVAPVIPPVPPGHSVRAVATVAARRAVSPRGPVRTIGPRGAIRARHTIDPRLPRLP